MSSQPPGDETRPVLPDRSEDDRDEGWGERAEDAAEDDRRFLEDRPPHHDGRTT